MKTKLFFFIAFFMCMGSVIAQNREMSKSTVEQTNNKSSAEVLNVSDLNVKSDVNKQKNEAIQKVREADSKAAKAKRDETTKAVRQRLEKNKKSKKKSN